MMSLYLVEGCLCALVGFMFVRARFRTDKIRQLEIKLEEAELRLDIFRRTRPGGYHPRQKNAAYFDDDEGPSAQELAEVYRSLGCAVPPSVQRKVDENNKTFEEIMKDLEDFGGPQLPGPRNP